MDISVVIPAYNAEKFIRRSLDSVISQIYSPVQIIVVNDGSSDRTASIIEEYENVVLINQENSGVSNARNSGIEKAKGHWIAFLDADDQWESEHLQNAVEQLRKNPDCKWYSDGHLIKEDGSEKLIKRCLPNVDSNDFVVRDYFLAIPPKAYFGPSTIVVKKECFNHIGLFDEKFIVGEDRDMLFRLALQYPNVAYHVSIGATMWARRDSLSRGTKRNHSETLTKYEYWESVSRQAGAFERAKPRLACWVFGSFKRCIKNHDYKAAFNIFRRFYYLFPFWGSVIGGFANKMIAK